MTHDKRIETMSQAERDDFNMSMRKFLKQVGVTSQKAIEDYVRDQEPSGRTISVTMVLSDESGELHHEVTGDIKLP